MVTVEEAKRILFSRIEKSPRIIVPLNTAFDCILFENIFSPIDLPSFNQSAMDGYALASPGNDGKPFEVIGEIKAGDPGAIQLQPGQAVRIYTGAEVPASADAIVIQEKVVRTNGSIQFSDHVRSGDCIRFKGSQIRKGELALTKGTMLNPAAIGFLASLGINAVPIYKTPRISIIATGNELIMAGNALINGHVYESNSVSLQAALNQMHIKPTNILFASDTLSELKLKIEQCVNDSDMIILTGGISVGQYDLVHQALTSLNVETLFYKVAQKPGKPFFCGKINDKLVFALPGNPAAVLVCFYEYIYPTIRMMQYVEHPSLPVVKLKLLKSVQKKEDRAMFIRGKKINDGILPLEKQDSNMLRSFAEADGLIYLPIEKEIIHEGEEAEVHLLPFKN